MTKTFNCKICGFNSNQNSHHKAHLSSQKHKDKCTVFKLTIQKLTKEELIDRYNTEDIQKIIKHNETFEKIELKNKIDMSLKKRKTNTIIYKNSNNNIKSIKDNEDFKNNFLDFLGKMHNLLRGVSVTGDDALDDILHSLFLCYLEDKISSEGNFDLEKSEKSCYKGTIQRKVKDYVKYAKVSYLLQKNEELRTEEGINSIVKCGKILTKHPATRTIITKEDFINCPDTATLCKLLKECQEFSKSQNIFEQNDIIGYAYEYMTTKHAGNGGVSKEMGQYFTERPLIHMCLQLIEKSDITELGIDNNSTIGDEFCATYGFPLIGRKFLKNNFNIEIKDKNMYGVEYHERLSKLAHMNALFSMKECRNIIRGNSFITNVSPHLDISFHNVPFGKSMTPKNIKKTYESFLEKNNGKKYPKYNDFIPYNKKKIDAILASQVVLYKTKKMGIMIIKDGEETSGKNNSNYRKWFSGNCIIKKIMKIPSGSFSCTGTKTVCIYFIKNEKKITNNIQFLELCDEGNKIIEICNVSMDDMEKNHYSWDHNTYIIDEDIEKMVNKSTCDWSNIGNNVSYQKKSKRSAKYGKKIGKYPFFRSSNTISQYVDQPDYEKESVIIGDGGKPNINYSSKFSASDHCIIFNSNNKLLNTSWIYHYFKNNLNILEKYYNGAGIENISKDKISNLPIPIPPIERQTRAIEEINNCDKEIENLKLKIKKQEEKKKEAVYKAYN